MIFHSPWLSLEPYPTVALHDYVGLAVSRFPDKPAFVSVDGKQYTFREVWQAVLSLATLLQQRGVRNGDVAAIFSLNCPEYFVAFHAAISAGASVTTVNPMFKERELGNQLAESGASILFAARSLLPIVEGLALKDRDIVLCLDEVWELASELSPAALPLAINPREHVAVLPFSSGTTGLPKGVMVTHSNMVANIRQFAATGAFNANSIFLNFLPFYHMFGLTGLMNTAFAVGATQVVLARFDPKLAMECVERFGVDRIFLVPPALLALVDLPNRRRARVESLKHVYCGAAPLPAELVEAAERAWGWSIPQVYGLTEATCMVNVTPTDRIKQGSVGPPVADTEFRVVHLEDGRELGPEELGELLVRGPQVSKGLWKQADHIIDEEGWLRTGDIVRVDSDSYMYVLDRKKEMIKYKGYQVAPAELEAVLMEHPKVRDAAVIRQYRDEEATEVPKAFVVLGPGEEVSADELLTFVAEKVAPYKKVREVEFVKTIPRTPSGKILRRHLADGII